MSEDTAKENGTEVWSRNEIESPCTNVCQIHPDTDLCLGCARSLGEIGAWSQMSADERGTIMAELPTRSPAPTKRRGGRKARLERGST
jgi:predicted Fe-S protein YdhL (DUF1289 family)